MLQRRKSVKWFFSYQKLINILRLSTDITKKKQNGALMIDIPGNFFGMFWSDWTQHSRSYWYAKKEAAKRKHRIKKARFLSEPGEGKRRKKSGGHVCFPRHTLRHKKWGHVSIDRFFSLPPPPHHLCVTGIRKRGVARFGFSSPGNFFLPATEW